MPAKHSKTEKPKDMATSLRLPVEVWEEIKRIAERKRLSMNSAIIFALEEYCQRETAKGK